MKLKFVLLLLFFSLLSACKEEARGRKMNRIITNESGAFTESDQALDRSEVMRISTGLTYYNVDQKIVAGEIFLQEKEFSDMNYLYNIQKKCLDTVWYNQHIIRYVK